MSSENMVIDPAVHSILRLTVEEKNITLRTVTSETGIREERVRKLVLRLESHELIETKLESGFEKLLFRSQHLKRLEEIHKYSSEAHEDKKEEILELLDTINYRIIKKKNNKTDQVKELSDKQKEVLSAIKHTENRNYRQVDPKVIKECAELIEQQDSFEEKFQQIRRLGKLEQKTKQLIPE